MATSVSVAREELRAGGGTCSLRTAMLRAIARVAEGAVVRPSDGATANAAASVAAVLQNRWFAVLGGRSGLRRSLGSVHAAAVLRFLDNGSFRGTLARALPMRHFSRGVAVTRDARLLTSTYGDFVARYDAHTGKRLGSYNNHNRGASHPSAFSVSDDGAVFITERKYYEKHTYKYDHTISDYRYFSNVLVWTPDLVFSHDVFVGPDRSEPPGVLTDAYGVCATARRIFVAEGEHGTIAVYTRGGAFVTRFGARGTRAGQLGEPRGVCLTAKRRALLVAELRNERISMFTVAGAFVRHLGARKLTQPSHVACSLDNDVFVAGQDYVSVLNMHDELLLRLRLTWTTPHEDKCVSGLAWSDGSLYVQTGECCCVFQ